MKIWSQLSTCSLFFQPWSLDNWKITFNGKRIFYLFEMLRSGTRASPLTALGSSKVTYAFTAPIESSGSGASQAIINIPTVTGFAGIVARLALLVTSVVEIVCLAQALSCLVIPHSFSIARTHITISGCWPGASPA